MMYQLASRNSTIIEEGAAHLATYSRFERKASHLKYHQIKGITKVDPISTRELSLSTPVILYFGEFILQE